MVGVSPPVTELMLYPETVLLPLLPPHRLNELPGTIIPEPNATLVELAPAVTLPPQVFVKPIPDSLPKVRSATYL